mmetsp:Transcript_20658/g.43120  ORF Transcript_20658/g.43120 Transcript_20658/m.43120 type:complete len:120 (+) Transcript_20658:101-460(+)
MEFNRARDINTIYMITQFRLENDFFKAFQIIHGNIFFFMGFHWSCSLSNFDFNAFKNAEESSPGSGNSASSTPKIKQQKLRASSMVRGRSSIKSKSRSWYPNSRHLCRGKAYVIHGFCL